MIFPISCYCHYSLRSTLWFDNASVKISCRRLSTTDGAVFCFSIIPALSLMTRGELLRSRSLCSRPLSTCRGAAFVKASKKTLPGTGGWQQFGVVFHRLGGGTSCGNITWRCWQRGGCSSTPFSGRLGRCGGGPASFFWRLYGGVVLTVQTGENPLNLTKSKRFRIGSKAG